MKDETKKKISDAQLGEKNHAWKGDKVGYVALHDWIKSHWIKPPTCDNCFQDKKLDLANKTGVYDRDFKNWFWLCRSCHRKYDKRPSPFSGKKHTLESRKKTSETIKKWWAKRKQEEPLQYLKKFICLE